MFSVAIRKRPASSARWAMWGRSFLNISISPNRAIWLTRLAGSFAVINLVGVLYEKGRQKFASLHAQGAEKLAQAAREAGAQRFVQFSALGVDNAPKSKYARTKHLGEKAVLAAFPNATILRPSVVFGREDHFFNQFAGMSRTGFLPLIGGGKTKFQPVYVSDVADAVSAALSRPDTAGKVYELGGPEVFSLRGIYDFIARATGRDLRYIDLPFACANLMASLTEWLPKPPLTTDQVQMLKYDSVVTEGASGLSVLGIAPTAIELVVPEYLARYAVRKYAAA